MKPVTTKNLIYDQVYMVYDHYNGRSDMTFVKYAGIFSELLLVHTMTYGNFCVTGELKTPDLVKGKWFKLTKHEVICHVYLEKITENI